MGLLLLSVKLTCTMLSCAETSIMVTALTLYLLCFLFFFLSAIFGIEYLFGAALACEDIQKTRIKPSTV